MVPIFTRCIELNRIKCTQYWPEGGTAMYGDITVESLQCEEVGSCNLRTFRVQHMVKRYVVSCDVYGDHWNS